MVTAPRNRATSEGLTRAQAPASRRRRRLPSSACCLATTPQSLAGTLRVGGGSAAKKLTIVAGRAHVVPGYDAWFDSWAESWGASNGVDVSVDHVDYTSLPQLAAKESKAGAGHDLFGFLAPPVSYEDAVIDHSEIVAEIEKIVGPAGAMRQGQHAQRPHRELLRRLRRLRSRADHLASRPLELGRRVSRELGPRPERCPEASRARSPDRDRSRRRARFDHGAHRAHGVLRLVPPGRDEPADPANPPDDRGGRVHGEAVRGRRRSPRVRLVADVEQPVAPRREGVTHRQRDLGDSNGGRARPPLCEGSLALADPAWPRGRACPPQYHERLLDLEVHEES